MKFDTAYCLSLDEKLSIYDVRDLNFDETAAFDSDKDSFLCPNDDCRAAFAAGNVLGTFNGKNVNYLRTPHFKNLPSTRHIEGCRYASHKATAGETEDGREENFPSEFVLTRRQYDRKAAIQGATDVIPQAQAKEPSRISNTSHSASETTRTRPASSHTRSNATCPTSTTRTSSRACR